MSVLAVQAMRKMRGGSQSQLMLGADSNLWVVKFQNNPQHLFVLANEFIATHLAAAVGLSVPTTEVIEVTPFLVEQHTDMEFELRTGLGHGQEKRSRYAPGIHFGSQYVGGLMPGATVDYLPDQQLDEVINLDEFAGILCLDKWACNCDGRQAVFTRRRNARKYKAVFIDQGCCFNAGDWTFPDAPLLGVYCRNRVYAKVTGWDSFEPWLSRIEAVQPDVLAEIAASLPLEWFDGDRARMDHLMESLLLRRSRVRELILSFRHSNRAPFPNWV